ncbi:hypothetical protein L5515_016868 [Caenorhabditis briggsae]|uniref:BTB domain-containing protein n=1 Tax=Caenorhabditis briggsae TaxID=6238 RepID=A0AAE9JQS7_CAEBR|nr:hypothetical protein L5515_016868 [Caenorhabditis briggsae]
MSPSIFYQTGQFTLHSTYIPHLDFFNTNGIKCSSLGGVVSGGQAILNWNFDWNDLYNQGLYGTKGHIIVKERDNIFQPTKIEVNWAGNFQNLRKIIEDGRSEQYTVSLEYSLSPFCDPREAALYDEIFAPSDMTDAVLVVEGKQIHVNKAFLSIHSDYFKALFSKNFKEGRASEIELSEVSYNDFGLLCSRFYPNPQFPDDKTVERLLIMARRFLVSSKRKMSDHQNFAEDTYKKGNMVKDDDIPECQDYIEAAETNVPEVEEKIQITVVPEDFVCPVLVPDYVKDIFWKNLAFEKEHIAKAMDKRKGHRNFPMRDMFKVAVSQQDLVNEYYRSKNVERREMMMREETPLERSSEISPEILETLKEAGIQVIGKSAKPAVL